MLSQGRIEQGGDLSNGVGRRLTACISSRATLSSGLCCVGDDNDPAS